MSKSFLNFVFFTAVGLILFQCANRGTANGGPKDETPPVVVGEEPKNFSTNFDADEIKIYFDEYIKFKNLTKATYCISSNGS